MKMLVRLQMTPLLGSLQLGSAWKLLLCVGKVFPPSDERNHRQGEGCVHVPVTSPRSWLWIIEKKTTVYLARPVTFQREAEELLDRGNQTCFGVKGPWQCPTWVFKGSPPNQQG